MGAADFTKPSDAEMERSRFESKCVPAVPWPSGRITAGRAPRLSVWSSRQSYRRNPQFLFLTRLLYRPFKANDAIAAGLVPAIATDAVRKRPGRTEYLRGIASPNDDGQLIVRTTGSQGSGILRPWLKPRHSCVWMRRRCGAW